MEESTSGIVLEKTLLAFRGWTQNNCSLWAALQDPDWVNPPETDNETLPEARSDTEMDSRLAGWLDKSRKILGAELQRAIEKISDGQKDDPHPAMRQFGLLGDLSIIALHETVHTRLLAWFLDPAKPHGLDDLLLRKVCELSGLKNDIDGKELQSVAVHPEYTIRARGSIRGRIDIVIEARVDNKALNLWIEAKTSSNEGPDQLSRYANHLGEWRKKNPSAISAAVFLTPEGRDPISHGEKGRRNDHEVHWQPLAYPQLALALWRASCLRQDAPGRELLRLYLTSVLRDLGGWPIPLSKTADYSIVNYVRGELE